MVYVVSPHELRAQALELTGAARLREFHRRDARHAVRSLLATWLVVAGSFWLGAQALSLPLPLAALALLGLAVVSASRINALNVLVHDGSHGLLARSRSLNRRLCNLCAGYWILVDDASYRRVHSRHHRFVNRASDPDFELYMSGDGSGGAAGAAGALRGVLADLTGLTVWRRARVYAASPRHSGSGAGWVHLAGKAGAQLSMLATAMTVFGPWQGALLCVALWWVPLVCLFPVIIRLRTTVEHAPLVQAPRTDATAFICRTTHCGWLERILIGAQMEHHLEHHLFPSIPCWQLPRLHRELLDGNFFGARPAEEREHLMANGFLNSYRRSLSPPVTHGATAVGH